MLIDCDIFRYNTTCNIEYTNRIHWKMMRNPSFMPSANYKRSFKHSVPEDYWLRLCKIKHEDISTHGRSYIGKCQGSRSYLLSYFPAIHECFSVLILIKSLD